ncbi:MAG: murein hydrolase activator EnvC family protein [bacterium]
MRFPLRQLLAIWLTASCLLTCPHIGAADGKNSESVEKAKLEKVGAQIQHLQKGIESSSREAQSLQEALEKTEKALAGTRRKIADTRREIQSHKSRIESLGAEKTATETSLDLQKTAIASQINASYRLGREPTLKLLLNQEDPGKVGRIVRYHDYFLRARAKQLETYFATLNRLAALEADLNETIQALSIEEHALNQSFADLERQKAERASTLAQVNSALDSDKLKLEKLHQEKKRLELVIDKLTQAITEILSPGEATPFTSQRGKLGWPSGGKVSNRFGQKRSGPVTWDGIVLRAPEGSGVKAIHHGRVVFADYLRGQGLLIVLDHGAGYMSLYAHNQVLLAETGDWISAGATIAKVGQTGGQKEPGLYFEIRKNGQPTNPVAWLQPRR